MSAVTAVPIRPLAAGSVLKLWLALIVLCFAGAALAWVGTGAVQIVTTDTGVRFQTIRSGEGPVITSADLVAMRYRLTKQDGTLIEDSDQTGQPFVTGTEGLFPGFSEGLQLMQAGGKYILYIPPGLHVQGPMPPGAPFGAQDTLVFEVEVLQIAPGMAAMQQLMGPPGAPPSGAMPPEGAAPPAGPHPTGTEGESLPVGEPTGNSQR